MQTLTFESTEVHTKSGNSSRTGKPYNIREQSAWLHVGQKFPVSVRIQLGDQQPPYAPGDYAIERPFIAGRFESLQVSRDLGLTPIKAAARAVA